MKRFILIALVVIVLSLMAFIPALAQHEDHCDSGQNFGQHHAEMAQAGELGKEMNPGMHQGFSHCP